MSGEHPLEKLGAYFDGELSIEEARLLDQHLRGCPSCAAEGLRRVQMKRAVHAAGQKFAPDPAFRARMEKKLGAAKPSAWKQRWLPVVLTATAALLIVGATMILVHRSRVGEQQVVSELIDQHVMTLASANPVDVVSTDRHTVKPWFEGRIPFTFNLPELQDTGFTLVGGRISYLGQSPGAELIFRIRLHQISVFIFQEDDSRKSVNVSKSLSFEVRSWTHNGLRYFVVGDTSPQDVDKLSELMKKAG